MSNKWVMTVEFCLPVKQCVYFMVGKQRGTKLDANVAGHLLEETSLAGALRMLVVGFSKLTWRHPGEKKAFGAWTQTDFWGWRWVGMHTGMLWDSRSLYDSQIRKTAWELQVELSACLVCTKLWVQSWSLAPCKAGLVVKPIDHSRGGDSGTRSSRSLLGHVVNNAQGTALALRPLKVAAAPCCYSTNRPALSIFPRLP